MTLYEIKNEFTELFDRFEELSEEENAEELLEAWFDTLDGIEQGFQDKAEAVAVYIKNLTAESEMLKDEENALKARRRVKENSAERLKKYLFDCMTAVKLDKIDAPRAAISIRNNPESVFIANEKEFIKNADAAFLRQKPPEIDKTAVKTALKAGTAVDGAELVRTRSLQIK